ncbi:hypothetical protein OG936_09755 [Streptomyces sp. NBC_00846]|uniref:SCO2400 family protein n=1 Tax=Streptomyces sp. NBC_00846 TaxID=2975849 RepID=UPI003867828B|nr:hypothetical protein OG936_09755 [Streptomyces sp. NBC_00846]
MDYCHPCQRHLNGALACAGCGTPAEAPSHYATPAFAGHEPDAEREPSAPPRPGGRRGGRDAARPTRGTSGSRRPDRRAGAQRRGKRAHRRRGRTALLVAIGVVLAAGMLSLAELAIEPNGDDRASDYVREAVPDTTEPAPARSASGAAERPGPVDGPSVLPATDAHPAGATGAGGAMGSARPEGSGADSPRPEDSAAAPVPESAAPSASMDLAPGPDATEGAPGDPSEPARPGGGPTRPAPPASPTPTPTPTRSETCWFLWFCS